ncbi:unnamed protein product [Moneuplotes crassus]|uniref:Uncharacterized protein n=1 Tax=Euplotes crassus TaxID=5936 RepID=A0AAD1U6C2_EUPCR|nr:unnamed protein product [Moneuplotes crassus]
MNAPENLGLALRKHARVEPAFTNDLYYDSAHINEVEGYKETHLDEEMDSYLEATTIIDDLKNSSLSYKIIRDINQGKDSIKEYPDFYKTIPAKAQDEGVAKFFMVLIPILIIIGSVVAFVVYITGNFKLPRSLEKYFENRRKGEIREDHMEEINSYFEKELTDTNEKTKKTIKYRVGRQMEENTKNHIEKCDLDEQENAKLLAETKYSAVSIIMQLYNHTMNEEEAHDVYSRFNCFDINPKNNPYRKLCDTYYYRLNRLYKMFDTNKKLLFTAEEIISDLKVIYRNDPERDLLDNALNSAKRKISSNQPDQILRQFVTEVWSKDSDISGYLIKSLIFDSLHCCLTDEIPDFFRKLFKKKAINYYKTVLRTSTKFFLALNHFIAYTGDNYDENYQCYIFVKKPFFQKSEKKDRYRIISYTTAQVCPQEMPLDKFYGSILPEKCDKGFLVNIKVPAKCNNCAMINEMYGSPSYHPNEVIISPYSLFTFQSEGELAINLGNEFAGIKQINVELDRIKTNLVEDEAFWTFKDIDLEKNY